MPSTFGCLADLSVLTAKAGLAWAVHMGVCPEILAFLLTGSMKLDKANQKIPALELLQ